MEADFLRWLRQRLPPHPLLKLGVGDDAALLATAGRNDLAVTTDLIAEGVDFDLKIHSPQRIGHKALAINLSDLAAMAVRPLAAVIALNLPRRNGGQLAMELYEGMLPLAEQYHVAIAGGDTNSWDGSLVVSITALGEATARGSLCRRGAQPGDRILVTGRFGGSILGRHLDVQPRVDEALLLHQRYPLHAGIDCSDGLALDLWRMCQESSCGAELNIDQVPITEDAEKLSAQQPDGISPLEHALADGEDFELILAVPPEAAERMLVDQPLEDVWLTEIGRFVAEQQLFQCSAAGEKKLLEPRGYQHHFD
jgi:thiamine-monophosphate kinase